MNWNKLDNRITRSEGYKFFQKHERLMIFIQGLIVIGLLFGIVMFFMQDLEIKEQIRDNCGYTTDNYECVCDQTYVDNWKKLKTGGELDLNLTDFGNG